MTAKHPWHQSLWTRVTNVDMPRRHAIRITPSYRADSYAAKTRRTVRRLSSAVVSAAPPFDAVEEIGEAGHEARVHDLVGRVGPGEARGGVAASEGPLRRRHPDPVIRCHLQRAAVALDEDERLGKAFVFERHSRRRPSGRRPTCGPRPSASGRSPRPRRGCRRGPGEYGNRGSRPRRRGTAPGRGCGCPCPAGGTDRAFARPADSRTPESRKSCRCARGTGTPMAPESRTSLTRLSGRLPPPVLVDQEGDVVRSGRGRRAPRLRPGSWPSASGR